MQDLRRPVSDPCERRIRNITIFGIGHRCVSLNRKETQRLKLLKMPLLGLIIILVQLELGAVRLVSTDGRVTL